MGERANTSLSDLGSDVVELIKEAVSGAIADALSQSRNPELLTEKEAAKYLNVRPQTLASWRHQGKGPHYTKLGSSVRYERIELEAYVNEWKVVC